MAGSVSNLRLGGAPISWGVCEVPGWGHQMGVSRVLREAASLGLSSVEAGPDGFLPTDPHEAADLLAAYGLRLVAGFVPAILHRPERRHDELALIERRARELAAAGAQVLVLAAATGGAGYEQQVELTSADWAQFFETLNQADEITAHHGLVLAVHPHHGTLIAERSDVLRFLEGCEIGLCLDTGHLMLGGCLPLEIVETATHRVRHVHLKDVDRRLCEQLAARRLGYVEAVRRKLYRPLGEGAAGIREIVEGLRRVGYAGWYVLEQDMVLDAEPPEGEGPIADVRKSLEFLHG